MVQELDKTTWRRVMIVTFCLWLITAVIGFWQIELVRDLMLRLLVRFTPAGLPNYEAFRQTQVEGGLSALLVIVTAVIWIVVIIGSAEYHRTRLGQPGSWQLFAAIIGVEIAIFSLPLFI
jgi:hypothetical protein